MTDTDRSSPFMPPMIAVCSWSLQPQSPAHLCQKLDQIGIRRVQLAFSPLTRARGVWSGAIETLGEHGIEIVSGMMEPIGEDYSTLESIARTGGIRPDETWTDNCEHAAELAALAEQYGISLITMHAGFLPEGRDDPERQRMVRRLQIIADLLAAHRIRLGLETGQEDAATLLAVLEDVARPNVGVNVDPANMILYGKGDPVEAMRMLRQRVVQVHIKDALPAELPGEWGSEVPVGDGAVPWREFLEIVQAIEPPVNLVIEREAGDTRLADVITARERIEQWCHAGSG